MARTAITPVNLIRDGGISIGNAATLSSGGMYIPSPGPYQLELLVENGSGSTITAIVRASNYSGAPSGAANSGSLTAYQPFTQASVGDLSIPVVASAYVMVSINTTDRFVQSDGSIWIDTSAQASVYLWAFTKPYVVA
jgi:hypothetical protein